jgi:hypothetical protein
METTKSIYDKNGKTIQIGNTINVAGLETMVLGFSDVAGTAMVSTEYGDFNPSIIEVVNPIADATN